MSSMTPEGDLGIASDYESELVHTTRYWSSFPYRTELQSHTGVQYLPFESTSKPECIRSCSIH
jgi:hypothetical protein